MITLEFDKFTISFYTEDIGLWLIKSENQLKFWSNPLMMQWLELKAYQVKGELLEEEV